MASTVKFANKAQAGFTLLELLISLVIIGMVLTLAMASYAYFINEWERTERRPASAYTHVRNVELVQRAVESTYDYHVLATPTPYRQVYVPFFLGTEESFRFITGSPVFAPGELAVAELRRIPYGADTDQTSEYELEYREWSMTNQLLIEWSDQPQTQPQTLTLFAGLSNLEFEYYGFEDQAARTRANYRFEPSAPSLPAETAQWFRDYRSRATELMPEALRITLNKAEEERSEFTIHFRLPGGEPSKSLFLNEEF